MNSELSPFIVYVNDESGKTVQTFCAEDLNTAIAATGDIDGCNDVIITKQVATFEDGSSLYEEVDLEDTAAEASPCCESCVEKKKWTRAFINTLADSAFLYIAPGGRKDGEGKTVPRSLRYFPYKDKSGKVDLPHLRNAIARIPVSNAPGLSSGKKKALQDKARRLLANAMRKGEATLTKACCPSCGTCNILDAMPEYAVKLLKVNTTKEEEGGGTEERFVLGVVLEPETVDSQDDVYSEEEVRKTAHLFMEHFGHVGLMHQEILDGEIKILETYLAPADFEIEGQKVKKGTWLLGTRIVDDILWDKVKKGEFTGWSIGGFATRVVEEEGSSN